MISPQVDQVPQNRACSRVGTIMQSHSAGNSWSSGGVNRHPQGINNTCNVESAKELLVMTGEPKWEIDVKVVLAVRSVSTGHISQRTPHPVDHEHEHLKENEPYQAPRHRHASDRRIYGDRDDGTRKDGPHYRMDHLDDKKFRFRLQEIYKTMFGISNIIS